MDSPGGKADRLAVEQRLMLYRELKNRGKKRGTPARLGPGGRYVEGSGEPGDQLSKSAMRKWWRGLSEEGQQEAWAMMLRELREAGMLPPAEEPAPEEEESDEWKSPIIEKP